MAAVQEDKVKVNGLKGMLCRKGKKQIKMTMEKLKGLQIGLNRKTMRMEPVQQSREV